MFFDEVDFVRTQNIPISELWYFLPFGYIATVLIETPILVLGLSSKLSLKQKLLAGLWLTACTYPIVVIVLPTLMYGEPRYIYLLVAETFAPIAECLLFWLAYRGKELLQTANWIRSFAAIVVANLASFIIGEIMHKVGWFGLF